MSHWPFLSLYTHHHHHHHRHRPFLTAASPRPPRVDSLFFFFSSIPSAIFFFFLFPCSLLSFPFFIFQAKRLCLHSLGEVSMYLRSDAKYTVTQQLGHFGWRFAKGHFIVQGGQGGSSNKKVISWTPYLRRSRIPREELRKVGLECNLLVDPLRPLQLRPPHPAISLHPPPFPSIPIHPHPPSFTIIHPPPPLALPADPTPTHFHPGSGVDREDRPPQHHRGRARGATRL